MVKPIKRYATLLVILCAILTLVIFNVGSVSAFANTATNGDLPTNSEDVNVGTNVIYINNEADFTAIFCQTTAKNLPVSNKYVLMSDLYLDYASSWKVGTLAGIFDGNGHTIVGLDIISSSLFSSIEAGAVFKNTNFIDTTFSANANNIAIIASSNLGTISNINMTYSASVANATSVVGFVNNNAGTIENSYVNANLTDTENVVNWGGFVGVNGYKFIKQEEVDSDTPNEDGTYDKVTVDVTYEKYGNISNSYSHIIADGTLKTGLDYYIVNTNQAGDDLSGDFTAGSGYLSQIEGVYQINTLIDAMYYCQIAGEKSAILASNINIFNADLSSPLYWMLAEISEDSVTNTIYNAEKNHLDLTTIYGNSGEQAITPSATLLGSGSKTDPYLVATMADFALMANDSTYTAEGIYVKQVADISFVGYSVPNITFSGYYEGCGYSISGLNKPLFVKLEANATIRDLYILGSVQTDSGLVKDNYGKISDITARMELAEGVAGLVVNNYGAIKHCDVKSSGAGYAIATNLMTGTILSEVRNQSTQKLFKDVVDVEQVLAKNLVLMYTEGEFWCDDVEFSPYNSIRYFDGEYTTTSGMMLAYVVTINPQWVSYAGTAKDRYTLVFSADRAEYKTKISDIITNDVTKEYDATADTTASKSLLLGLFTNSTRYDNDSYTLVCKWYENSSYSADKEIELGTSINNAGQYYALLEVSSTETQSVFHARATYTIARAKLTYDKTDFSYIKGVIDSSSQANAIQYNGQEFDLTAIKPQNLPVGVTCKYKVVEYSGAGSWINGDSPLEAGIYKLGLVTEGQSSANYDITLPAELYIKINPLILKVAVTMVEEVTYNTDINLNGTDCYLPEDSGILSEEDITDINLTKVKFSTDYTKGVSGVKADKYYIQVDTTSIGSANYIITAQKSYFTVVKADIDADTFGWTTTEVEYDGGYKNATVAGDTSAFSITYKDNNNIVVPTKGYIDAGDYVIKATINYKVGSENYNNCVIDTTLKITPKVVVITAEDKRVQFKDEAPTYTATYTLVERADNKTDDIGTLVFNCGYIAGYDRTTQPITVSGASNSNYTFSYVEGKLYVDRADRDIVLNSNTMVFDGTAYEPTVYCNKGGHEVATFTAEYYTEKGVLLQSAPSAVGKYRVTITTPETDYYNAVTEKTLSFEIKYGTLADNSIAIDRQAPTSKAYAYNGVGYTIGLLKGLPENVDFTLTYEYTYKGTIYELDQAPIIKEVGSYTDITIIIKSISYYTKTIVYDNSVNIAMYELDASISQTAYTYNAQELNPTISLTTAVLGEDKVNIKKTIVKGDKEVSTIKGVGTYIISIVLDNGNYSLASDEFTVTVEKAVFDIDLAETEFNFTYGNAGVFNKFNSDVTYTLADIPYTQEVEFVTNNAINVTKLNAGTYSITSIGSVYFEKVESVKFNVINGKDKVKVAQKIINFDWSDGTTTLQDTYVYDSIAKTLLLDVKNTYFKDQISQGDTLGFSLSVSQSMAVDVGVYTVIARITNSNYVLNETSRQKSVEITKAPLTVSLNSINTVFNEALPTLTYGIVGLCGQDSIDVDVTTNYSVGDNVGTYGITATASHKNYDVTIVDGSIVIAKADITGVTVKGGIVGYNGQAQSVTVNGTTATQTVTISSTPTEVGEYTITVLITALNHNDLTLTAEFTIVKAKVDVTLEQHSVLYRDNIVLKSTDIKGTAVFNGQPVVGEFSMQDSKLILGSTSYDVTFTPQNSNLATATVKWQVESYVEETDIQLDIGNGSYQVDANGTVTAKEEYVKISIASIAGLENANCELYVNGYLIQSGVYTVWESTKDVKIEIKLDGVVLYSKTINFVVAEREDVVDPGDDKEEGDGQGNTGSDQEENTTDDDNKGGGTSTGTIIGISCGAVAVIAIAIAIIIIVKKKK